MIFLSIFHKSGSRGPGPHPKVPTRHQHGPQGSPNGAQGCRNEAPRSPQSAQKPPNYTPCVSKWKPKVPQWRQKATQSAKETPQGLAKCHKDLKNMFKPPAAGCSPKATYPAAGRGTTHQAACRRPRSGAEAENRGSSNKGFVLILK